MRHKLVLFFKKKNITNHTEGHLKAWKDSNQVRRYLLRNGHSAVMSLTLLFYPIFLQLCEEGDEPELVAVDCGRCGQLLLSCRLSRAGCGFSNTSQCTTTELPQRALHKHWKPHIAPPSAFLEAVNKNYARVACAGTSFNLFVYIKLCGKVC